MGPVRFRSVCGPALFCLARALAVGPKVLLMDEPCASLDPISTARIEGLLQSLKESVTILFVTHNLQQAGLSGQQYKHLTYQTVRPQPPHHQ